MFHSCTDVVRIPKKPAKPAIIEVLKFKCDICGVGDWHSENEVEIHRKFAHFQIVNELENRFKNRFCTMCMNIQDSDEALISHIKSHHLLSSPDSKRVEHKIYMCDICWNIFFNKDLLAVHILYTHEPWKFTRQKKVFTCPKCFKTCQLTRLWSHFQTHSIPSVSLCDICLTNFPSRADMHEHVKSHNVYNGTKKAMYKNHLDMHASKTIPRRKVKMEVIRKVFKKHRINNISRYYLQNALRGLHLPSFIEICTLCREICLNKTEVEQHMLRDHTEDEVVKKTHLCICGKEFPFRIILKQHVMKTKGVHEIVECDTVVKPNYKVNTPNKKDVHIKNTKKQSEKNEDSMEKLLKDNEKMALAVSVALLNK